MPQKKRGRGRKRAVKRKNPESVETKKTEKEDTQVTTTTEAEDITKKESRKSIKKPRIHMEKAAIRPRTSEQVTLFLKDIQVVHVGFLGRKPSPVVDCVNFHREDVFGHGSENLNKGFGGPSIYLVPIWTPSKHLANITGFELVFTNQEDPNEISLTKGPEGRFVYLKRTFDPANSDRIIGLQLYRSKKFNPPTYGWPNHTANINEGRGGDNLCLQWDLGSEGDIPGAKYQFNRR